MRRAGQPALFVLSVLLAPIVATVFYLLVRDTLPSQVPDFMDWPGFFDGEFETQEVALVNGPVVSTTTLVVIGCVVMLVRGFRDEDRRWIGGAVCGVSQLAWLWCWTLAISIGASSADAVHPQFWQWEIVIAISAAHGFLVYRAMPRQPRQPEPAPASPIALGSADRVFWFGRSVNRAGLTFTAILVGASVVAAAWSSALALSLLILAALSVLRSAATVRIDDREVRLCSTPVGWPVRRIALSRLSRARVIQPERVRFFRLNWGEEIGDPDPSSAVFGNGPVLLLDGPEAFPIALSLPNAAEAADVLNALIARQRAAVSPSSSPDTPAGHTIRQLGQART